MLLTAMKGFSLSEDRVILSGSHSHSGPGAVSPELLWVRIISYHLDVFIIMAGSFVSSKAFFTNFLWIKPFTEYHPKTHRIYLQ
jgi:hypothetical protein